MRPHAARLRKPPILTAGYFAAGPSAPHFISPSDKIAGVPHPLVFKGARLARRLLEKSSNLQSSVSFTIARSFISPRLPQRFPLAFLPHLVSVIWEALGSMFSCERHFEIQRTTGGQTAPPSSEFFWPPQNHPAALNSPIKQPEKWAKSPFAAYSLIDKARQLGFLLTHSKQTAASVSNRRLSRGICNNHFCRWEATVWASKRRPSLPRDFQSSHPVTGFRSNFMKTKLLKFSNRRLFHNSAPRHTSHESRATAHVSTISIFSFPFSISRSRP
jgi:hypothetical protein